VPFDWKGERYVAVFSSKSLVGVKVKTGAEAWRLAWVTRWDLNIADPIVAGNHLFISSFDQGGALVQLAEPQPKVVWKNKSMANHFNSCVCLEGHLYGVDGNTDAPPKDLRCVELATGQVKWRYEGLGLGALVAADGMLVVLSDKGELVIARASPRLFRPLSRAQVLGGKCWTTPVLAIGRVYCRNAQGILVCLDVAGRGPR
jgi:outer membrane protein assembly factor BamB